MRKYAARRHEIGGHQKCRPVHRMKAQDVLTYHVQIGRPKRWEIGIVYFGIAECGDVVGERVEPDIDDMSRISGDRYAPAETRARDRQVLQSATHKADDFIAAAARSDRVGMGVIPGQQAVLPSGQPEKIVFLLEPFDFRPAWRQLRAVRSVQKLALVVERLVAHRVPSGKPPEIDFAAVFEFAPQCLYAADMTRLGRANEIVVADIQKTPYVAERAGNFVRELLRRETAGLRRTLDLL